MGTRRVNEPIVSWQAGDSVTGFALVRRKERRQDRNGRDFIDLELADATGSMAAKIWGDSPALESEFEAHQFVAFKGTVKSYRDQLQLSVQKCRVASEQDRERGFDESNLIPTTKKGIPELWSRLEAVYDQEIDDPILHRLARNALAQHGSALREHPAAKAIHHAYRGGLLEHTVSMAELACVLGHHYAELDTELLLLGVLFHDLGKLHEIGPMPVNEYTPEGRMIGHIILGRDLLREQCKAIEGFPEELQLHLEHLVLSHQGLLEFGSPIEPMTAEAIALHMIDNLDSKLAQLSQARESSRGFQFLRGIGRVLYLGPEESEEKESDQEDPAERPESQAQLKLET
jgi:3'-5' exoribonuclease